VVIAVIAVAANSSGGSKSTTSESTAPSTTKSEPAKQPEAKKELSNQGEVSSVKFQVTGSSTAPTYGKNQFMTAKASGIFKIVKLTVTNNQKDAITMDGSLFKLIDDKGREFTASTEAQSAAMADNKEGLFLKQINPGLSVSGEVVFDVPPDAKGFKLKARGGMTGKDIELKVD